MFSFLRRSSSLLLALCLAACGAEAPDEVKTMSRSHASIEQSGVQSAARARSFPTAPFEILQNPGFEIIGGGAAWQANDKVMFEDPRIARTGKGFAWLGGYDLAQDYLQQTIKLDSTLESASLRFWYYIRSANPASRRGGDKLTLSIENASTGLLIRVLTVFTDQDAKGSWQQSPAFDLTNLVGRNIRIRFFAQSDVEGITDFVIDDVSLSVTMPAPIELRLAGTRADHVITLGPNMNIVDKAGNRHSLENVVRIHFTDSVLTFDPDGSAGRLYRLYRAVFGRVPDLDGLGYWIDTAAKASLSDETIADAFIRSEEFVSRYGALDNMQFLTKVYENVLERKPDSAGIDFWHVKLSAGQLSRSQLMLAFADSAENRGRSEGAFNSGVLYVPPSMVRTECPTTHAIVQGLCAQRPVVLSAGPREGLQSPGTSSIVLYSIRFDQFMKLAAEPAGFSISPAIPGSVWRMVQNNSDQVELIRTAGWTPASQVPPNTEYQVRIAGSVIGGTGASLGADAIRTFTTSATCRFGLVSGSQCVPPVCVAPQVLDGNWRCVNRSCPEGQVLKNGRCEARVSCVLPERDFDNNCRLPTCELPFVLEDGVCVRPNESTGLKLASFLPAEKARVVSGWYLGAPFKTISATFNENLNPNMVTWLSFRPVNTVTGSAYAGTVTVSGKTATYSTQDARGLPPGDYRVELKDSIRSASGVRMGAPTGWNFTVVPEFTVSPVPDSTANSMNTGVQVDFPVAMQASSFTSETFKVWQSGSGAPVAGRISVESTGLRARFQPHSSLPQGTTFSVLLTTGIKTAAGVPLHDDYGWSFRTLGTVPIVCPPPNVVEFGQCVPSGCQLPKVLKNGQCVSPTPDTPGTGTPGTSTRPDADGCFVPRHAPECLTVESNTISASFYHVVKYRNACGARVVVTSCIKGRSGRQDCGQDSVRDGALMSYFSYDSSGVHTYRYTGSTKTESDWTCIGKDPLTNNFKG